MTNIPWMIEAQKQIGTKEYSKGSNPKIMNWAKILGPSVTKVFTGDHVPWCGLFVGYCLAQMGIKPVDSVLWARAWSSFGFKLNEPAYGCVIVFSRGPKYGHVGFYVGENANYYYVLGGNQSDMVNIAQIAKSRALAFRWPNGMEKFLKRGRVRTTIANARISLNEV